MTDKRGWTFFLGCAVVSVPAFLIDDLRQDPQGPTAVRGTNGRAEFIAVSSPDLTTGVVSWPQEPLRSGVASKTAPIFSEAQVEKKSAPVRDKPGVAASPVGAAARYKSVKRKLTVYGNGDGYLGRRTADETRYTKDGFWVAYNEAPLGATLKVDAEYTCDKGHKNLNTESLLVKDRTAKKLKGIVIDATLKAWLKLMWCETCGKCKPYGKHDVTVRRIK